MIWKGCLSSITIQMKFTLVNYVHMPLCHIISKLQPHRSSPPLVIWSIKSCMQQLKLRHSSVSLFPSRNQMIWCVSPPLVLSCLLSHRSPNKRGTVSVIPLCTQNCPISPLHLMALLTRSVLLADVPLHRRLNSYALSPPFTSREHNPIVFPLSDQPRRAPIS
jgi:hypothetical protein